MVHAKMGITESSVFTCATWATVHNLHGLSLVLVPSWTLIQALSKNLNVVQQRFYVLDTSVCMLAEK